MGVKTLPQASTRDINKYHGVQRFQSCIKPMRWLLQVLSLVPYRYNEKNGQYEFSWCSVAAWRTIFTAIYVTVIVAASIIGLVMMFIRDEYPTSVSLAGVILIMQCLLNAWVQLLCTLGTARRQCRLMNSWCFIAADSALNITKGMKLVIIRQLSFLAIFWSVSLSLTLFSYPEMIMEILDVLGHNILLLPRSLTLLPAPLPLVRTPGHD